MYLYFFKVCLIKTDNDIVRLHTDLIMKPGKWELANNFTPTFISKIALQTNKQFSCILLIDWVF